jgi:tetratricopeptide (TPR) repeat protein
MTFLIWNPHKRWRGWPVSIFLLILSFVTIFMATPKRVVSAEVGDHPSSSAASSPQQTDSYIGSSSCRGCHEPFYQKWATSHHGLAMQPYTDALAVSQLAPPTGEIEIQGTRYLLQIGAGEGWVLARTPNGEAKFPIVHVMGGKNVYYLLTPLERGRLQVLPVAYDVRNKRWIDTTGSAVRHFGDRRDTQLDWKDPALTFNTSCYSCHVSQLATNYNFETDTYHTVWTEPGINCETCHGSAVEHVKLFEAVPKGESQSDIRILSTKKFNISQMNALCAPCHAKMSPLSTSFPPGSPYFDYFDLITLENEDFYPDGRDLGENYTMTSWMMSPCVKGGELSCMHCHTSSGRIRYKGIESNNLCIPCHEERVKNATAHTHHLESSTGNLCISCHMPATDFARMRRSDHSMRPPMPSATLAFGSPNACNICHVDKDVAWADKYVREWRTRDYQALVVRLGSLIDAARKGDWTRLTEMLDYVGSENRDVVFANSFVRLLRGCEDSRKWPSVLKSMKDSSPLIRASAAESLDGYLTPASIRALLDATHDEFRLVRVRAAAVLAAVPGELIGSGDRESLDKAMKEYLTVLHARPDDSLSHYNLGNYYMDKKQYDQAIQSYETAIRFQPESLPPRVNASLVYNLAGRNDKAEECLRAALKLDPKNAPANLNLGLLLGEMGRTEEAESALKMAFGSDPQSAVAAFNLGVIAAQDQRLEEAIDWYQTAYRIRPGEPKYAVALAHYYNQRGMTREAIDVLKETIGGNTQSPDPYSLLGQIYEELGQKEDASTLYRNAAGNEFLSDNVRSFFRGRANSLERP